MDVKGKGTGVGLVARGLVLALALALDLGLAGCEAPNEPPTVRIIAPREGELQGGRVAFEAEAQDPDGRVERVVWDFGDGGTAEGTRVTHEYAESGTYRVEVRVEDDRGAEARDGITIEVQVGPKAVATVRPAHGREDVAFQHLSGEVPLTAQFDGTRSVPEPGTRIVKYLWDFGDGKTGEGPQPVHVYERPGEYTVTLTVTDDRGRTAQARLTVEARAYEPLEGALQLGDLVVRYRLHKKEKKLKGSSLSMFYQYVVEAPRRLTAEEIEAVLEDIVERARGRPRVTYIVVHLFDAVRRNFMAPRAYAHYLGTAVWDALAEPDQRLTIRINAAYVEGRGLEVLGYALEEGLLKPDDPSCGDLCGRYRLAFVEVFIQDEPICREQLINTLREIARWRLLAGYHGFAARAYTRDLREVARAVGWRPELQGELALEKLPPALDVTPEPQPDGEADQAGWERAVDEPDLAIWVRRDRVPPCP